MRRPRWSGSPSSAPGEALGSRRPGLQSDRVSQTRCAAISSESSVNDTPIDGRRVEHVPWIVSPVRYRIPLCAMTLPPGGYNRAAGGTRIASHGNRVSNTEGSTSVVMWCGMGGNFWVMPSAVVLRLRSTGRCRGRQLARRPAAVDDRGSESQQPPRPRPPRHRPMTAPPALRVNRRQATSPHS